MNNKVAIIVTTMLRDELLEKCIDAMLANLPENATIFVADQGRTNEQKSLYYNGRSLRHLYYYTLPYNCGLSYGRNFLVNKAHELGYDFCLIASDSMIFNEKTKDLSGAMKEIAEHRFDLVGLHLNGAAIYWVGWLTLVPGKYFELDFIDRSKTSTGRLNLFDCSSCHNFFIATTASLLAVKWDDNLKLAEHEDFFYRYTQAGYKCAWTPDISCDYFKTRFGKHALIRQMNWNESLIKLLHKYRINQWISQKNRDNGFYGGKKDGIKP